MIANVVQAVSADEVAGSGWASSEESLLHSLRMNLNTTLIPTTLISFEVRGLNGYPPRLPRQPAPCTVLA